MSETEDTLAIHAQDPKGQALHFQKTEVHCWLLRLHKMEENNKLVNKMSNTDTES